MAWLPQIVLRKFPAAFSNNELHNSHQLFVTIPANANSVLSSVLHALGVHVEDAGLFPATKNLNVNVSGLTFKQIASSSKVRSCSTSVATHVLHFSVLSVSL
jgi:hypothetical protein